MSDGSRRIPISVNSSSVKNTFSDEATKPKDNKDVNKRMQAKLRVFIVTLPMYGCAYHIPVCRNTPLSLGEFIPILPDRKIKVQAIRPILHADCSEKLALFKIENQDLLGLLERKNSARQTHINLAR
jgi:hypothetical protein